MGDSPSDRRQILKFGLAMLSAEAARSAADTALVQTPESSRATIGRPSLSAATRVSLAGLDTSLGVPAILTEPGREGIFVWSAADLSAEVAADTRQAIHVAASSDPAGRSGAWVRQFDDIVDAQWFGIVEGDAGGAHAAANNSAWNAMRSFLESAARNATPSFHGLPAIRFGVGTYEFSQPLELYGIGVIEGAGIGATSGHPTILEFYNSTGFRLQTNETTAAKAYNAALGKKASSGTIFRDLAIVGNHSGGAEAEHHGIEARARFYAYNVAIEDFAGDGYHVWADNSAADGEEPPRGSANGCIIVGGRVESCRDGISLNGDDANAGSIFQVDVASCRRWGINENSVLGNNYFGCKIAGCGRADTPAGNAPTMVFHGGGYYGVIDGQESGASTNPPSGTGTDNSWWYFMEAARAATPARPQWVSGTAYRAGGPIRSANSGAQPVFVGVYIETGDQADAQIVATSLVLGGLLAHKTRSYFGQGPAIAPDSAGRLQIVPGIRMPAATSSGATGYIEYGLQGTNSGALNYLSGLAWQHSALAPGVYRLKLTEQDNTLRLDYSGDAAVFNITTPGSPADFGTGSPQPHWFWPAKMAIGETLTNARLMTNGTAAPVSGAHAQGEIVWNRAAAVGRPVGWVCTATGTPGTWVAMANL